MSDKGKLRPTLWRTVRAVMNVKRLRLLRDVFAHDGEFCVREIARRSGLDDPTASMYLRQMNARGLLGVRRDRIKVFYNTDPDRSLPEAIAFQSVLRKILKGPLEEDWESQLITVLRCFSHFNRLSILLRLSRGPARYADLMEAIGVCVKGFYHHIRFLLAGGLIVKVRDKDGIVYRIVRPKHPVAVCLLRLLLADRYAVAAYFNPGSGRETDAAEKRVLRQVASSERRPRKS